MHAPAILKQAEALVAGDRAVTYGDITRLHLNIVILWNAWMKIRRDPVAPLDGEDVAHMEALLKMARTQSGEGTTDNYVDGAAYLGIAGELSERRDE